MKKANYRIKVVTFKTGRQLFYAQFKTLFYWTGLSYSGETGYSGECNSRNEALEKIDKHFNGNNVVQSIDIEYVSK